MNTFTCTLLALSIALPAGAQTRPAPQPARPPARPAAPPRKPAEERGFFTVNAGVEAGTPSMTDSFTYELYAETATTNVSYGSKAAALIDVGGGVRVFKKLFVGVAVSHASGDNAADVTASLPHPLYLNRPREVNGTANVTRSNTAVHVQVLVPLQTSRKWRVMLFGGPSFFDLAQDVVSGVEVDEVYPYDTATFRGVTTENRTGTAVGFHAGVDIARMMGKKRNFGIGGLVRYAKATVQLDSASGGRTIDADVGGLQAGGGIRIRF
jgi:hypothetical protein